MNVKTLKMREVLASQCRHLKAVQEFQDNIWKACPKCGHLVPYRSKGCDNCLFQFKETFK